MNHVVSFLLVVLLVGAVRYEMKEREANAAGPTIATRLDHSMLQRDCVRAQPCQKPSTVSTVYLELTNPCLDASSNPLKRFPTSGLEGVSPKLKLGENEIFKPEPVPYFDF